MIAEDEIYWLTEPDFWKTIDGPNLGQMGQNRAFSFSKFGSLVFREIAYNDSLQTCITSSRGKIHEKKFWGPNLGRKGPKSGPKLGFLLLGFLYVA